MKVYDILYGARRKWRNIGMKLGLELSDLDNIESQYGSRGNDRCLENVVSTFLNRPSLNPTWQLVIDALKSKMVDEEALAVSIEGTYGEFDIKQVRK